jgi:hypothetical protein
MKHGVWPKLTPKKGDLMNRTAGILLSALIVLLFSAFTVGAADFHIVRPGENLSTICAKYGASWQEVAKRNNIQSPNLIYPDQKIMISMEKREGGRRYWDRPNGDPLNAWTIEKMRKAVLLSGMPDTAKAKANSLIGSTKWTQGFVRKGQVLNEMFFGNYRSWRNVEVRLGQYHDDKVPATLYEPFEYGGWTYHTGFALSCGNYFWWKDKAVPKPHAPAPRIPEIPFPPDHPEVDPRFLPPPPPVRPDDRPVDKFELIAGAGNYLSADGLDNHGWYAWAIGKYRPFNFYMGEDGRMNVSLGAAAYLAGGAGDADGYDYNWWEWGIGPTFKLIMPHMDFDLDLLYGRLYNYGGIGLYDSEQTDSIGDHQSSR